MDLITRALQQCRHRLEEAFNEFAGDDPTQSRMELRSPEFMRLRFFGLMIQLASATAGITLALLYGRLRTREERQVDALRTMYKLGTTVSLLRTTKPGPLLDLDYVEHWSPALDLVIVAKTVKAIITGDGAY